MDIRGTLSANENFIEQLRKCYDNKEKVSIIVDDGGLVRTEGFIKENHFTSHPPYFELQDGTKINVHSIVALNGTFLSDYSEC